MKKAFEKIKEFFSKKIVKKISILLGIFAAIIIVECAAFNFRAIPNRGEVRDYESSQVTVTYATKTEQVAENGHPMYTIPSTNMPRFRITFDEQTVVNTVYIDVSFFDTHEYKYNFKVSGYYLENSYGVTLSSQYEMEVVQGDEHTKYFLTEFNHAVNRIDITLASVANYSDAKGLSFAFGGIGLNHKMPFHFSFARVLSLMLLGSVTFILVDFFIRRKEKEPHPKKLITMDTVVYALPIVALFVIYTFFGNFTHAFCSPTNGTQISKELVDAFMHGHVYLDAEPSEVLKNLPNPYDPNVRGGAGALWDHLYFDGKYYSYYGVTPVFLLFLPFRLITGQYLYDAYGVLLFSTIGLVFMALAYDGLIKLAFKDRPLPLFMKYMMFALLALGCGILFNVERPYFYEVSTSCAFMCMMIMLFHLVRGGLIFEREQKRFFFYHLAFASFWGALAVLSRATMALYALCHLIYLGFYFFKKRKEMDRKSIILFFSLSLAPYLVFGILQAVYNYARFGSFLDFGIEYSLTIADFKNMPFHFGNVLTSLYNFLFGLPSASSNYFFLRGNNLRFGNAYYFFETSSTIGLFIRMPVLWVIFVLPFLEKTTWKEKVEHLCLRWLPCVIIPFIQVAITWQSGFATRYYSDFAWPLMLFALSLLGRRYQKIETDRGQAIMFVFLLGNIIISSIVTFDVILVYVPMLTHHYVVVNYAYTRFYYHLGHEFTFWR